MAKDIIIICPEKNVYLNGVDELNLTEKQEASLSFEGTPPLNPSLHYIIVPQKNTACQYTLTGGRKVISKRFFLAGFNDAGEFVEVRTVGVQTLRAMGYAFVEKGVEKPLIQVEDNGKGNYRAVSGTEYVHALDDTRFIKVVDHRATVEKPVVIRALGARPTYTSKFDDETRVMVVDGDYAVLQVTNMKTFENLGEPSAKELVEALKACAEAGGANFYAL